MTASEPALLHAVVSSPKIGGEVITPPPVDEDTLSDSAEAEVLRWVASGSTAKEAEEVSSALVVELAVVVVVVAEVVVVVVAVVVVVV